MNENEKYEWWCRKQPLEHRLPFNEETWEKERLQQPQCCGKTMSIQRKRQEPIKECNKLSCVAALNGVCRCYTCEGKFHATERWRNHYLKNTQDEYLIYQPLKIEFKIY